MYWWKKCFLIEGTMDSNSMFVTMSCLSDSSMLSSCKVKNDADTTYPLLSTFKWDSIFFDIMEPNSSFFHC